VLTIGGGVVTTVDRQATFDTLTDLSTDLQSYTEGNLAVQTQVSVQNYGSGYWYANGGYTNGTLVIV
jgi:hypothetical protein